MISEQRAYSKHLCKVNPRGVGDICFICNKILNDTEAEKVKKKISKKQDYRLVLISISNLGMGIREDLLDWQNIGKMAVSRARQALEEKCKTCGKPK